MHFFTRNHLGKKPSKLCKNKFLPYYTKLNFAPALLLTPFSSKTVKDRENLLTHCWKLSLRGIKCKKNIKIGWKIKKKYFLQNHILKTLWNLLYKKRYKFYEKTFGVTFIAFAKKNHQNRMRKKFQKLGRDHFWTPYKSNSKR